MAMILKKYMTIKKKISIKIKSRLCDSVIESYKFRGLIYIICDSCFLSGIKDSLHLSNTTFSISV